MLEFVKTSNAIFWGWLVIALLIGVGIYFTLYLKFPYIRHFKKMFKVLIVTKDKEDGVSSFGALCTAIGGQVGTGNLAGVATAIASGGPGAVFWMWIIGIVGMPTIFAEAVLGQLYREKNADGSYRGGPAYYIEKGLKQKWMSVFFSVVVILGVGFIISMVQSNSIASGFKGVSSINPLYVGIVIASLAGLVVFGGVKKISNFAQVVVPFMAIFYVLISLFVVLKNIGKMPEVFALIIASAFGVRSVAGGVLGFTVKQAFRYGTARGLFSNEAGQGTTPNIHAAANVKHPATQGFAAMISVVIDTLIICTSTAFIILLSGTISSGKTGIELSQLAMTHELGGIGKWIIFISILFFAFTTLLADIYYGEVNLQWLFKDNKIIVNIYKVIALLLVVLGSVIEPSVIWELADFFNALMIFPNVIALFVLSKYVKNVLNDYEAQIKIGNNDPVWDWDVFKKEQSAK